MVPFPHPAHRTEHADLLHSALEQDFMPTSHATLSVVSEHFPEFIGCPISRSLTTFNVCLELRSLSSASITRLHRYYGPLRHHAAPGLAVTGCPLAPCLSHAMRLPVLRKLSCCAHAVANTPADFPGASLAHFPRKWQPFPSVGQVGSALLFSRPARRSLLVTACALAESPDVTLLYRTAVQPPYFHGCSDCYRLERKLPGGICPH